MKKKSFLIVVVILLLITLTGCDSNASISNNQSSDTPNVVKKTYGLNEDVYITNDNGEYRLKITGIRDTSYRNEFSDIHADRVVIISYEYENISQSNDLYITDFDFKVYDIDNNSLESYPADTKYSTSVGIGRKSSGEMAYALNNNNNYVELEFYDNIWNSSSDCLFKLEW